MANQCRSAYSRGCNVYFGLYMCYSYLFARLLRVNEVSSRSLIQLQQCLSKTSRWRYLLQSWTGGLARITAKLISFQISFCCSFIYDFSFTGGRITLRILQSNPVRFVSQSGRKIASGNYTIDCFFSEAANHHPGVPHRHYFPSHPRLTASALLLLSRFTGPPTKR